MAVKINYRVGPHPQQRYFVADTYAELPVTGLNEGDTAYAKDTDREYLAFNATTWANMESAHESASDPHPGYVREADADWIDLTDLGETALHSHAGGGSGAPTDADYLVGTAHAGLSAEIVVGPTPGGELGGTWGSPTVDATHAGSAHHAELHVAAHASGGADAILNETAPSTQAFGDAPAQGADATKAAKLLHKHGMPANPVPAHEAAGDPHPGYVQESAVPGGELGGTYATPTVDATHSGSTHHAQAHDLDGADHTLAGEVAGEFMRATSATGFAFESVPFSRGGTILDPAGARFIMVWRAPFACTVTNVRGHRKGGTGATVNARRNQTSDHLAADLSLTSENAWMDGGAVQNTAYIAGDDLEIEIASIAGAVTEIAIQVDFTRP